MTHPPVEILIQAALGIASESETDHINTCANCRAEVRDLTPSGPASVSRLPEHLAVMDESVGHDRQTAIEQLEGADESSLCEIVRTDPVFRSEGGFHEAIGRIPAIRSRNPKLGLQLAHTLLDIGGTLAAHEWTTEARADVLREAAVSQRTLGNYPDARALLDQAEETAAKLVVSDFMMARIWYERACLEIHTEGAEARAWAEKAAEVFRRFGDQRRWNRARFLLTLSYYNERNYRSVVTSARDLLPHISADGDNETEALCWSVVGHALTKENQPEHACEAFDKAIGLLRRLDMPVEELRSHWGKARADLRRGGYQNARLELQRVRERFEDFGLREESSIVGLDLTECLILEGNGEEARAVCRKSLSDLQNLFSGREQQRALAYLAELSASDLAADEVRHVSGFLQDSIDDPHSSFHPRIG